jgi:hypothetical protein
MAAPIYKGGRPFFKPGIRTGNNTGIFNISGAPTNGTSGTLVGVAGPGSVLLRSNGAIYINTNTKASPTWTLFAGVGAAAAALITYAADGAISIASQVALLTKGSAAAMTVAAPGAAGIGTRITIVSGSNFAHVITFTGGTLGDGTTGLNTTVTMTAFIGSAITVIANTATQWVTESSINLTSIA